MKPYQDARVEGEKLAKQYAELEKADQVDFFNDTATTEIYTLSLHDALPISLRNADSVLYK